MMQQNDQPTAAPSASATPDDRSTAFRAVEGGTETHSGTVLLVEAYAAIWLILMGWLLVLWRNQRSLNGRLDDLERSLSRAEKARAGGGS